MENIQRILRAICFQRDELNLEILKTPTGEKRNILCDVNIHLMEVEMALKKVKYDPD